MNFSSFRSLSARCVRLYAYLIFLCSPQIGRE